MISRLVSYFLAAFSLALAACEAEPSGSPGQYGTLRFAYSTEGICAGCALDNEVLAGSVLTIDVHGVHPKTSYQVRSTAPAVAEFHALARCRYVGEQNCSDRITVVAKSEGDADLEVFDDWTGTVMDRVTVKVRDAAVLSTIVKGGELGAQVRELVPGADGVYELKVDSDVEIVSKARSKSGFELLATSAAVTSAYENEHVVGPRSNLAGPEATEYAKAKRPGVAAIALAGGSARTELLFRVVE